MIGLIARFLPGWWLYAAIAASVAALFAWHAWAVHSARVEGRAEAQAMHNVENILRAETARTAVEAARQKEATHAAALTKERALRTRNAAVAASAADDARTELDRLRDAIAAAGCGGVPEVSAAGRGTDGSPAIAGELFGACAAELVEMGAAADGLTGQVSGLQGWVGASGGFEPQRPQR